ncbi:MAG: purine-binding chemotaxis protein CheW [Ignavibacteriae bacterium]|nr:purine-binding chemotaxis protein CheW [Ignavibacteriota bacterium]
MEKVLEVIVFHIDNLRFAISLDSIIKVIAVVEITPLPEAPSFISGIINLEGRIIPVAELRLRMGMPKKNIQLSDQIIVAATPNRLIGILIDTIDGINNFSESDITPNDEIMPAIKHINSIAKINNDIIFITNLESFFSLEEEIILDKAIKNLK